MRAENARETALVAELKGKIETLEKKAVPPGAQVMGVQDAGRLMNCRVNIRGEVKDLGPEVTICNFIFPGPQRIAPV